MPLSGAGKIYLAVYLLADDVYLVLTSVTWISERCMVRFDMSQFTPLQTAFHTRLGCQITAYLGFVSRFVLEWMLVAMVADSYMAVSRPFKKKNHSTRNAKIVGPVLTIAGLVIGISAFYGRGPGAVDGVPQCVENDTGSVTVLVNAMLVGMFPPVVLPVLGVCLLVTSRQHTRFMGRRKFRKPTLPLKEIRVTLSLVLAAVFSLVLLPSFAWTVVLLLTRAWGNKDGFKIPLTILQQLADILLLIISAVFLGCVCLAGGAFRSALYAMMCCNDRTIKTEDYTRSSTSSTLHLTNGAMNNASHVPDLMTPL